MAAVSEVAEQTEEATAAAAAGHKVALKLEPPVALECKPEQETELQPEVVDVAASVGTGHTHTHTYIRSHL